tara:strand:+ start:27484 stop:28761 length:1278 start_codon:yes stop_codon:yes gene_type:complete
MIKIDNINLAIIGLGYVGLPLAIEFGKQRNVIGYDTKNIRVSELNKQVDSNLEISQSEFFEASKLVFTNEINDITECNCFIITVPTPLKEGKKPNLNILKDATKAIAKIIKKNNIVIYESTVYPGVTEEICVPILEKESGLIFNIDFFIGYSPERVNPGDKMRSVSDIVKVTSGSTPSIAKIIDELYSSIVTAGTYMAPSIKVAEAAKVIENTQRAVNIALINELAIIFNELEIDTEEVLLAAGSKWNFLNFRPGLVGGHCIGVDPCYLSHKAEAVGISPEIILASNNTNDNMSNHVVQKIINETAYRNIKIEEADILVMGFTFKENCPDIRNTKVNDIFIKLNKLCNSVDVYDPWVDSQEALNSYNLSLIDKPIKAKYCVILIAVAHDCFKEIGLEGMQKFVKRNYFIYDLKYILPKNNSVIRL